MCSSFIGKKGNVLLLLLIWQLWKIQYSLWVRSNYTECVSMDLDLPMRWISINILYGNIIIIFSWLENSQKGSALGDPNWRWRHFRTAAKPRNPSWKWRSVTGFRLPKTSICTAHNLNYKYTFKSDFILCKFESKCLINICKTLLIKTFFYIHKFI